MTRTFFALAVAGLAVCACGGPSGPQRPAVEPRLESGVTSSNGGGQRQTGGYTGVSIGAGGTTSTSAGPGGTGRGY